MNNLVKYLLILIVGINFVSYAKDNIKLYDKIVIIVNNRSVLKSEIELAKKWYNLKEDKEAAKKLIDSILLYQEAKKHHIKVYPQEVDSAILRIAKLNGINSIDNFKKFLEKEDIAYNEFYDLVKREITIQKYIQFVIKPKILENIKEAKEETYRKVRIIYLSKKDKDFEEKYQFLKKKLTVANFSDLAKKYSDDPITKKDGGLLGFVKKGELLKQLDEKVWSIKPKQIAEVNTKDGIYFILVEKEKKKFVPKDVDINKIKQKLNEELKLQLKKLKEEAVIQYLDKALEG